ncbi:MAG: ABC transporter ATP-binding protein [Gammaproteobacteria bacterium]|nr:ABC transporter ATP-binding protein [Gammaproteobacteria bacterium]
MGMMIDLVRAHPRRSLLILLAMLLAGVAEGLGLSTLLPLLGTAVDQDAAPSGIALYVTDTLTALGITPTIGAMLMVIVLGMVIKSLLLLIANRQVGYTVAQVATDLRLELIDALLASRWSYFIQQSGGALANSLATEAYRAATGFQYGATVFALAIQVMVYVALALMVSWQATVASLVLGLFMVTVLYRLVRAARRAGHSQTLLLRSLLGYLTDVLGGIKPLKAMGRDHAADALLRRDTAQLNRAMRREVISKEGLRALQEPMLAAFVALGLYVALEHLGLTLPAVMMLAFVLVRILTLVNRMQRRYQQYVIQVSAYHALQDTIAQARAAAEGVTGTTPPRLCRDIHLDDVWFGYGEETVLRGLDMVFPAGSFTTLTGPSGAGKSTLLNLLCALAEPQRGVIRVDGIPLVELDRRAWRHLIGYVPQDTVLFHETVYHNITVGHPHLTRDDAEWALRQAGAWDFVSALPEGLDTVVGERGDRMSGGQRQRIAIARALVHRPRLLILDEATSALDADSEARICHALSHLQGELTIVAVTHRPALVAAADRGYRLSQGTAVPEPVAMEA